MRKVPVNRNLISVEVEEWLLEYEGPVRCCAEWPECSHVLDWYEETYLPAKRDEAASEG